MQRLLKFPMLLLIACAACDPAGQPSAPVVYAELILELPDSIPLFVDSVVTLDLTAVAITESGDSVFEPEGLHWEVSDGFELAGKELRALDEQRGHLRAELADLAAEITLLAFYDLNWFGSWAAAWNCYDHQTLMRDPDGPVGADSAIVQLTNGSFVYWIGSSVNVPPGFPSGQFVGDQHYQMYWKDGVVTEHTAEANGAASFAQLRPDTLRLRYDDVAPLISGEPRRYRSEAGLCGSNWNGATAVEIWESSSS